MRAAGRRGKLAAVADAYYGWYVVGALFFSFFLGMGVIQGFGVYVETWEDDFGVSVGTISIAAALGVLFNGASTPLLGHFVDRFGGRSVIVPCLAVVGLGCLAMTLVSNVTSLIALYGIVIAFAAGGIMPVASGAIISRWFHRRRGVAISILTSGGSFSGLLLIPFLTYLLIATDWQTAWAFMGVIILSLGVPVAWLLVRNDPKQMGLAPDGGPQPRRPGGLTITVPPTNVPPLDVSAWRQSFRSAPMWQLMLTFVICGITTQSVAVHFIRFASDEGVSAGTAALAFGLLSAINTISALGIGYVSDRLQRRSLLGATYFVRSLAFVSLIIFPGNIGIWVFALVGGASWLATVPLTQSLAADVYGLRHLGILTGIIFMAHQIGGSLAVLLFGLAFDAWGSYDVPFAVSALLLAAAGFGALSIRERRYSVRYAGVPPADGD